MYSKNMPVFIIRNEEGELYPHMGVDRTSVQNFIDENPPEAEILREIDVEGLVGSRVSYCREVLAALLALSNTTDGGEIRDTIEKLVFEAWMDGQKYSKEQAKKRKRG